MKNLCFLLILCLGYNNMQGQFQLSKDSILICDGDNFTVTGSVHLTNSTANYSYSLIGPLGLQGSYSAHSTNWGHGIFTQGEGKYVFITNNGKDSIYLQYPKITINQIGTNNSCLNPADYQLKINLFGQANSLSLSWYDTLGTQVNANSLFVDPDKGEYIGKAMFKMQAWSTYCKAEIESGTIGSNCNITGAPMHSTPYSVGGQTISGPIEKNSSNLSLRHVKWEVIPGIGWFPTPTTSDSLVRCNSKDSVWIGCYVDNNPSAGFVLTITLPNLDTILRHAGPTIVGHKFQCDQSGIYTIVATSVANPSNSDTLRITLFDEYLSQISIVSSGNCTNGMSLIAQANSSSRLTYQWSDGTIGQHYNFPTTGNYTVVASTPHCRDTAITNYVHPCIGMSQSGSGHTTVGSSSLGGPVKKVYSSKLNQMTSEEVNVYPNPSSGKPVTIKGKGYFYLINQLGQTLQQVVVEEGKAIEINLPTGVYFLKDQVGPEYTKIIVN